MQRRRERDSCMTAIGRCGTGGEMALPLMRPRWQRGWEIGAVVCVDGIWRGGGIGGRFVKRWMFF